MRRLCLLAALGLPATAPAQTARDSVVAVVNEFFRTMAARDSTGSAAVMHPDGVTFSSRPSGDSVVLRSRSNASYLASVSSQKSDLLERMWDPTVLIHKQLAMVWTPYDFYIDRTFSHCGVDVFTLMRHQGRWKIVTAGYTVEPTGCAESPLGKPGQE